MAKRARKKAEPKFEEGFVALANRLGYEPGELLIRRRNEMQADLERLLDDMDTETHGWSRTSEMNQSAAKLVGRLRREIIELDLELMPYKHPRLAAQKVTGADDGPIEMVIRWQGAKK